MSAATSTPRRHALPVRADDGQRFPCAADPDLFFAEGRQDIERARDLCRGCPARRDCLAGALARCEPRGVWGGELFKMGRIVPLQPLARARAATSTTLVNCEGANARQARQAAVRTCEMVRRAVAAIGPDDMTADQAEAARLRLEHPELSLAQLGALAVPPATRYAMSARLRTLIARAGRAARLQAQPRKPRPSPRPFVKGTGSNAQSAERAGIRMCEMVRRAMAVLGPGGLTLNQAEAARLRLEYPAASLSQLAEMAWPPVSRHAMASRLRTLVEVADRSMRAEGAVA